MDTQTEACAIDRSMTPEEVGFLARLYREGMEWSQETVAELSGLTVRVIRRVEAGQPSSLDTRRAIARGFHLPELEAFTKPLPIPSAEALKKQKAAFDREYLVLGAEVVDGRKVVSMLLDGRGYAAIGAGDLSELPRAVQDAFAPILDYVRDCVDVAEVASQAEMLGCGDELDKMVGGLRAAGYCLCVARRSTSIMGKEWIDPTPLPLHITYLVAAPSHAPPSKLAISRKLGQPSF